MVGFRKLFNQKHLHTSFMRKQVMKCLLTVDVTMCKSNVFGRISPSSSDMTYIVSPENFYDRCFTEHQPAQNMASIWLHFSNHFVPLASIVGPGDVEYTMQRNSLFSCVLETRLHIFFNLFCWVINILNLSLLFSN